MNGNILKVFKLNIFKTIYFNFKLLPIRDAIRLPIFIGRKVSMESVTRKTFTLIKGDKKIETGCLRIGISDDNAIYPTMDRITVLRAKSRIVFDVSNGGIIRIYPGCRLLCNGGLLEIGSDVVINNNTS